MTLVYVLLAGALLLCFATGKDIFQTAGIFARGVFDPSTLQLMGVITLIEMLTIFLQLTGSLQRVLNALRKVFADSRVLIALVPTLGCSIYTYPAELIPSFILNPSCQ